MKYRALIFFSALALASCGKQKQESLPRLPAPQSCLNEAPSLQAREFESAAAAAQAFAEAQLLCHSTSAELQKAAAAIEGMRR